jgi:hypothetical protein
VSKKVRRQLAVITDELNTAIKVETSNKITIGALLIEAQEQVEHGEWMDWLYNNFSMGKSTAANYVNAAKLAAKFPSVGNLYLRASALYLLGGENLDPVLFSRKAIKAILTEAETKWVNEDRAWAIAFSLKPKPKIEDIEEEEEDEPEPDSDDDAADKEAEATLDEPPPELPPAPEMTGPDVILPPFDKAISTLGGLVTKPLAKFVGTSASPDDLRRLGRFLAQVAEVIDRQKQKAAEPSPADEGAEALTIGRERKGR